MTQRVILTPDWTYLVTVSTNAMYKQRVDIKGRYYSGSAIGSGEGNNIILQVVVHGPDVLEIDAYYDNGRSGWQKSRMRGGGEVGGGSVRIGSEDSNDNDFNDAVVLIQAKFHKPSIDKDVDTSKKSEDDITINPPTW